MAKKVLITGANGFIGSHLVRSCMNKGEDVYGWIGPSGDISRIADVKDKITIVEGQLFNGASKEEVISEIMPDVCYHLAWYVKPATYRTSLVNITWIRASANLFNLLAKYDCKHFIGAGTCFEYDISQGMLDESSILKPQNLYSACKLAVFNILEKQSKKTNTKFSWARIFYQYGPWENSQRLVPYIISKLLMGEDVELSSGKQIKDYLHIEDVASALYSISEHAVGGAVNIGSGEPVSVEQIAKFLGEYLHKPESIKLGFRQDSPDEPRYICANTKKLRSSTNWVPKYDLESGLKNTIDWFNNSLDNF